MKIRIAIPIVIGLALSIVTNAVWKSPISQNVFAQGADDHVIIPSGDNLIIDSDIATHIIPHDGDDIPHGLGNNIINIGIGVDIMTFAHGNNIITIGEGHTAQDVNRVR